MINKLKTILYTIIFFAIISMSFLIVVRGDSFKTNVPINEDFGNQFADPAITLVILGFAYVIVYRLFRHRNLIFRGDLAKYRKTAKENYKIFRRPLLFFHSMINLIATIFGILHGLSYLDSEWNMQYISGFFAMVTMVMLTLSGMVIYFRNNPLWSNKNSRNIIRSFHNQWIITSILIVSLLIHTSF